MESCVPKCVNVFVGEFTPQIRAVNMFHHEKTLIYVPESTCLECHDDCINKGDTWGECWHCARNHDDNYRSIG